MRDRGEASTPPLAWDGRLGPLAGLGLWNALCNVATLGFWRFWGRTRVRRAVWSQLALFGDRLEYTGTGRELFLGFLRVIALLLPVLIGVAIAQAVLPEAAALTVQGIAGLGLFLLSYVARQASRRYVASRTAWRGVRFVYDGSAWTYGVRFAGYAILTAVTLGLATPWVIAADARWAVGRLRLGSEPLVFTGRGGTLFWPMVGAAVGSLVWLFLVASFATAIVTAVTVGASDAQSAVAALGPSLSVWHWAVVGLAALLLLPIVSLPWIAFQAFVLRWRVANTQLAGARFAMPEAYLDKVLWLQWGNALLLLGSFGILAPVALGRTAAFHARHLRIDRVPDLTRATQAPIGPRFGEGLADYFDAAVA